MGTNSQPPCAIIATAHCPYVRNSIRNIVRDMQAHAQREMERDELTRGVWFTADMGGERVWRMAGYEMDIWDHDKSRTVKVIDGFPFMG